MMPHMKALVAFLLPSQARFALLAVVLCACSDEGSPPPAADAGRDEARQRPQGAAADVSETLEGGSGRFLPGALVAEGYVEHEYVAAGTATSYRAEGVLSDDGRWTFAPDATADYRTRVLVRRPEETASASGTVVVEWLNVSGGVDASPEYASVVEELTRKGHVWVGVSAQLIGVEGGPVLVSGPGGGTAGKGLKALDPARYGSLQHPGDGYAFDIFTQVARALLKGGDVLGGMKPRILLAAGVSQSAFALTTYYNGVQPQTLAFDGFFVHSRGANSLPLVGPGEPADLRASLASGTHPIFRDDLDAPVFELQAESDVTGLLNSVAARQPDSDRFRLWEVTGTAHADAHLLGDAASSIDCGTPVNNGPMHLVAKAALRGLDIWVRTGTAPPSAPRVDTSDGAMPAIRRDDDGIALGGLRTPPVDVPVDVLSGQPGPRTDVLCFLLGSTTPLPDARLSELYADRVAYEKRYAMAADETITAGFVLEDDRAALLGFAQPSRIAP